MDDALIGALVEGGSSLLSGILAGSSGGNKMDLLKEQEAFEKAQAEQKRKWQAEDRTWWEKTAKPNAPSYTTTLAPALDYSAANAVYANLAKRYGGDLQAKLGINLPDLLATTGLNKPLSQSPWNQFYQPTSTTPTSLATGPGVYTTNNPGTGGPQGGSPLSGVGGGPGGGGAGSAGGTNAAGSAGEWGLNDPTGAVVQMLGGGGPWDMSSFNQSYSNYDPNQTNLDAQLWKYLKMVI